MSRRSWAGSRVALGIAVLAVGVLGATGVAGANTPITHYSAVPSTSEAGGHPDVLIEFKVKNRLDQQSQSPCNCEDAKDATVHLPTGFTGNTSATPKCNIADFSADDCPVDSVVGAVEIDVGIETFITPVYNLIPPPDIPGLTAIKLPVFDTPTFTLLSARTDSDYGLDAKVLSIFHGTYLPLRSFKQILWGVPADPKHNSLRIDSHLNPRGEPAIAPASFCDANGAVSTSDPSSVVQPCSAFKPVPSNSPEIPFLQNATTCDEPHSTELEILSYDGGTDRATMAWPKGTGCSQLGFNPSLYAKPTTDQTDSPSGMDIELTVPQPLSPTLPSPSELKAASVTLPPGFSINPNAADGKVACTDQEANFESLIAAACPEIAKVASVEIESSALPGPLPGFLYLGQPLPGNRYRIFLTADGFGTHIKLPGTVNADPQTGQLVITFNNLPQNPLTAFRMHFFGSERGALATPTKCGEYPVTSTFVPWSERTPPQTSTQYFTLTRGPGGSACPGPARPFAPHFDSASAGNTAGAFSPFAIDVARDDGDQNLAGLKVATPPGFLASLKGIPYCPDSTISQLESPLYSGVAELAGPLCPAGSQVGTAVVGAGSGSRPLYVPGKVYLAGPYKGAPISLIVVTPAVTGPYDLGAVVVRAAVNIDPLTTQVSAMTDPFPQIIDGIPLRLRLARVNIDRQDFALNPTNCSQMAVEADIAGDEGGQAHFARTYQVANCRSLPYEPSVGIRLSDGVERLGHPAIHVVVSAKPGEANSRRISLSLPPGEQLDNAHFQAVCPRRAFATGTCPASSRIGQAVVTTPLLDQPLQGSVYLRASQSGLPNLALDLRGQFDIVALGKVDSVDGRLRTTFQLLPDAPVSRIDVSLAGGKKGLVINSDGLCGRTVKGDLKMVGQNGVRVVRRPRVQVACGAKNARHRGGA
jgi:hypothetical protein